MSGPTVPEWLEVGSPVAIVSGYASESISLSVVERFTATRVVLKGGDWFPLKTLSKSTGSFSTKYLKDPNSPRIVEAIRLQQVKSLVSKIELATRRFGSKPTDEQWREVADLAGRLARKASRP